jgi:uncharacterized protein (TIGR04551 family)
MGRFHPDYRVDLILFRNILSRVQGAYYLRPSVEYDFARNVNGQKFGGGASFVWSRASEPVQTPGHQPDLGVELDLTLYYQAKDGSLNDNHEKVGGFYTFLQYGVLFPLGGLNYLSSQRDNALNSDRIRLDTGSAQTLRWFLGVLFLAAPHGQRHPALRVSGVRGLERQVAGQVPRLRRVEHAG